MVARANRFSTRTIESRKVLATTSSAEGVAGPLAIRRFFVRYSGQVWPGDTLRITRKSGAVENVEVRCRIDTPIEVDYYQHGGILPFVLRQLLAA